MAALKLSSRQQAQLAFLETLPPKLGRAHNIIEQMGGQKTDDAVVRSLGRLLDEIKANSAALGMGAMADTAGLMSTMSRRGGGLQTKVRGLRELYGSLKINFDAALRIATTPESAAG